MAESIKSKINEESLNDTVKNFIKEGYIILDGEYRNDFAIECLPPSVRKAGDAIRVLIYPTTMDILLVKKDKIKKELKNLTDLQFNNLAMLMVMGKLKKGKFKFLCIGPDGSENSTYDEIVDTYVDTSIRLADKDENRLDPGEYVNNFMEGYGFNLCKCGSGKMYKDCCRKLE